MLNHLKLWICLPVAVLLVCGIVTAQPSQAKEQSGQVFPPPTIKYVLASPRAALIGPVRAATGLHGRQSAGAGNFPRENGEVKIPAGARVVFCLSRNLEGVWYRRSFGRLSVSMVLQKRRPCRKHPQTELNVQDIDTADVNDITDVNGAAHNHWVTIGRDGAGDVRRGPSIGRAKVGVPVLFKRPGVYLLRAKIRTTAQPLYPRPSEEPNALESTKPKRPPAAVAKDVVYVKVKVVNLPIIQIAPDQEPTPAPDAAYILPMPKEIDPNDPGMLSADLNGDQTVNLVDFVIMTQQWGNELEIP